MPPLMGFFYLISSRFRTVLRFITFQLIFPYSSFSFSFSSRRFSEVRTRIRTLMRGRWLQKPKPRQWKVRPREELWISCWRQPIVLCCLLSCVVHHPSGGIPMLLSLHFHNWVGLIRTRILQFQYIMGSCSKVWNRVISDLFWCGDVVRLKPEAIPHPVNIVPSRSMAVRSGFDAIHYMSSNGRNSVK